jgi:acyl-CoA synthetase (AMP-forming)/AMP-acid ligase II
MKKISSEIYQNFYRKNLVKIKNKKKIALIFENKKISYHTLLLNSDIVAFNLSKEKKFLKSTIIVSLENSEKYVYLLLAASKLNVSLLLINPDSTEVQIQKIKKKCKLVITDKKKT